MMENNASCTIVIDLIISIHTIQHVKSPTIIIININCLSPFIIIITRSPVLLLRTNYSASPYSTTACATVRGTVLLGLVIRAVALHWLWTANRPLKDTDITEQIVITICSSYLVFFAASAGSWPAVEMVMYRDHI